VDHGTGPVKSKTALLTNGDFKWGNRAVGKNLLWNKGGNKGAGFSTPSRGGWKKTATL